MEAETPSVGPFEIGTHYKSKTSLYAYDPTSGAEVRVLPDTVWFAARPVLKVMPHEFGSRGGSVHAPHVRMICRDPRAEDRRLLLFDVRVYPDAQRNVRMDHTFSKIKSPLMLLALAADDYVI